MSTFDIILIAIIFGSGMMGLYWGIIRQILSVVGLIAGITLATTYHRDIADLLSGMISNDSVARAVAFALIMVGVSGVASLIASILRKLLGLLFLGWLDHLIGGVIGTIQGVLLSTVVLMIGLAFPNPLWTAAVHESQIAQPLVGSVGQLLLGMLPDSFRFASQMIIGNP